MTLALLADAWGSLDDLDCRACEGDLREQRGCGRPPIVPDVDADTDEVKGQVAWTLPFFRRSCADRELRPDDEAAEGFYALGGRAGACAVTGSPWEMCPRAYLRDDLPTYSADAHRAAHRALRLYGLPERVPLTAVARLPLVPGQVTLLSLIERARGWREARQVEEMRQRAQRGSGGG